MQDRRTGNGDPAQIQADIDAIDRVLVNVLGFQEDIEAVTKEFKREAIFKRGELFRMICDLLREADRPLTTREIAEILADRKGLVLHTGKRTKEFITRVRHSLKRVPNVAVRRNGEGVQVWEFTF